MICANHVDTSGPMSVYGEVIGSGWDGRKRYSFRMCEIPVTDYLYIDAIDGRLRSRIAVDTDCGGWRGMSPLYMMLTQEDEFDLMEAGALSHLELFMDRLQLERNWLQGDYYLHTLIGHTDGYAALASISAVTHQHCPA